jgi:hypothetical protein
MKTRFDITQHQQVRIVKKLQISRLVTKVKMAKYTNISSKSNISDGDVGFMARERDSVSPYQSPDLLSGVTRECPEEIFAAESYDVKT